MRMIHTAFSELIIGALALAIVIGAAFGFLFGITWLILEDSELANKIRTAVFVFLVIGGSFIVGHLIFQVAGK